MIDTIDIDTIDIDNMTGKDILDLIYTVYKADMMSIPDKLYTIYNITDRYLHTID